MNNTKIAPEIGILQQDIGKWSDETFGHGVDRLHGIVSHLKQEVNELLENPIDLMEYADCMMLILDAARVAGISADQLLWACNQKLKVNKKRKWGQPDKDGVVNHI